LVPEQGDDHAPVWRVVNKIDTRAGASVQPAQFAISAARGDGVGDLVTALGTYAADYFGAGDSALISRARHRTLLRDTADALARAERLAGQGDELVAEELRIAIHSLGRLTGRVDVEDVLDAIFRDFCIGK
jgi:tRNA modification GTPase